MVNKLQKSFYLREDVVQLAKELLGSRLITHFDGKKTAGIIVETEAYAGAADKASHAYGGKRTGRTETMYAEGGIAYVYLCYGIHHLFNIVVAPEGLPHAILIRGIEPVAGISYMLKRCKKKKLSPKLTNGPGKLTRALGISTSQNGISLLDDSPIWIEEGEKRLADKEIITSPRIGVDYAGEDANLDR